MKTKFILPLIAIILLSSCSNKFSLQKRRYNKGFYFDLSSNHSSQKKNNLLPAAHLDAKKTDLAVKETNEPELKATEQSEPLVMKFANAEKLAGTKKNENNVQEKKKDAETTTASASKTRFETKNNFRKLTELPTKSKAKDSGDKLIIEIILCFFWFFNLIAVYMHDGKSFTLNFLVTLLLDLTFFLGVIFALLVVLDVINLA